PPLPALSVHLCSYPPPPTPPPYTLSLHDALPIFLRRHRRRVFSQLGFAGPRTFSHCFHGIGYHKSRLHEIHGKFLCLFLKFTLRDRKSTRLNSSHVSISYAVFCLKKKSKIEEYHT